MLSGSLQITLDDGATAGAAPAPAEISARVTTSAGETSQAGDVIVVPPGASVRIDNPGDEPASAWVATSVGLEAVLPGSSRLSPPWVG